MKPVRPSKTPVNLFNFSRLSIRKRLPLLICGLLLAGTIIFGWISYVGVKKAAFKVGQDRLQALTEQLSAMFSTNTRGFINGTRSTAHKESIRKYLLSNGRDSANEALEALLKLRKDTSFVRVELLNADRVAVLNSAKEATLVNVNISSVFPDLSTLRPDSGNVGKMYAENNTVYYPVINTVTDSPADSRQGKKIIGYLVRWRSMKATPQTLEQLTQLMGTGATLYIGNKDGKLWTDMIKPVSMLMSEKDSGITKEYSRANAGPVMAAVRSIPNTNWLVAIEFSQQKILEAARRFLYWIIIAGAVLLVLGIFAALTMSYSITQPLKNLTDAAPAIASGTYSPLAEINRHDEIGKLARALNAMAVQVKRSQKTLEEKAQKYKLLFEKNPMPMWIISRANLNVLDVNEAALRHYGYSRDEFMQLNTKDLRPAEDIEKYLVHINNRASEIYSGIWRHKKKDGSLITTDIIADDIVYKDEPARLILSHDVTEKIKAEEELSRQFYLRQKLITETTIQAQEKEREEIGTELHDNINQILAATKLHLELVLTGGKEMFAEAARKSYQNINLAIHEIRQLSKQLVPPSHEISLVGSLNDLVSEIQLASGIAMKIEFERFQEDCLYGNLKLILYRVVQEQINNIVKHSKAKNVVIKLTTSASDISLIITDDGIGFDTTKKRNGIGLRNISSRVGFYNGTMNIDSEPGKSCTLEVTIPLKQKENIAINAG